MPEEAVQQDEGYTEAGLDSFDHPNHKLMDDVFVMTVNNEALKTYIPAAQVESVKSDIKIMGALEKLYAGGYYDVDTARAIAGGTFTLERRIDKAREGFGVRMDHSAFNYDVMMGPKKAGGFLKKLFGRGGEEQRMYNGEPSH